jgi:hypothetical protein
MAMLTMHRSRLRLRLRQNNSAGVPSREASLFTNSLSHSPKTRLQRNLCNFERSGCARSSAWRTLSPRLRDRRPWAETLCDVLCLSGGLQSGLHAQLTDQIRDLWFGSRPCPSVVVVAVVVVVVVDVVKVRKYIEQTIPSLPYFSRPSITLYLARFDYGTQCTPRQSDVDARNVEEKDLQMVKMKHGFAAGRHLLIALAQWLSSIGVLVQTYDVCGWRSWSPACIDEHEVDFAS